MYMNLIFLDFDEVLTNVMYSKFSYQTRMAFLQEVENKYSWGDPSEAARDRYIKKKSLSIDPGCVHYLNMIVKQSNAKVVICSSLRKQYPFAIDGDSDESIVKRFVELFDKLGYKDFPVIGFTEHTGNRGADIALYMEKNNHLLNIERYLVIDDTPEYFTNDLTIITEDELLKEGKIFNNENNCYFKSMDDLKDKNMFFWSNQPLICTSTITGLTIKDALDALTILSSENRYRELFNEYNDFKHIKTTYNLNKYDNPDVKPLKNRM